MCIITWNCRKNIHDIHIMNKNRDVKKNFDDKLHDKINHKKSQLLKEIKDIKDKEIGEKIAAYSNSFSKK